MFASWKGRRCGGCTACCTVLGVHGPVFDKPAYMRCPQVVDGVGCGIYNQNRPTACGTYKCGWLVGMLPDDFYPPDLGVVIDTTNELDIISVREVVPGAALKPRVQEFIRVASRNQAVVVIRSADDRSLYGPKDKVEQVIAAAKSKECAS